MKKDVILTVFSTSQQAPAKLWAKKYFKDEPLVLSMPGNEFRSRMLVWCRTGDAFSAAVKELTPEYPSIEIGRRGLVTFSLGWSAADELFKFPEELKRLNAYLLIDGCHTSKLSNWQAYALRAAKLDNAIMMMAHSSIKPPFISTIETNSLIYQNAIKQLQKDSKSPLVTSPLPDYLLHAILPESIKIAVKSSKALKAEEKTWEVDPLIHWETCGELTRLHYLGESRCDHLFMAWHVQPRLWQWLGELWR